MLIVDAQVHIWSAGPPTNPSHRQVNSYTAEECIRDMDAAGVNACLLHPPGWDPNSGKISEEAAAKYPNRFAILGNFPLDKPENRSLIDGWKKRPGMLGLRYAFTQPHQANWMTDGTMDWLWPAAEKAANPDRADGVELSAAGRPDRRAASGPQIADRPLCPRPRRQGRRGARQPAGALGARQASQRRGQMHRGAGQLDRSPIPTATSTNIRSKLSRPSARSAASGAPTSPACRARGRNA